MAIDWIHPAFILIVGAIFVPILKGNAKKIYLVLVPALAFIDVVQLAPGTYGTVNFLDLTLIFGRVDKLSLVFGYIFTVMAFIGVVYGLHVADDRQKIAAFLYVGGSLGVTFAGDFFTLFVFWEIMAFASAYLIFAQKVKASRKAGYRYILVHIASGLCLLGGFVIHYIDTGSLLFEPFAATGGLAQYLVLIGFITNAAVPPLHAWLVDAYPQATVTGAVFMCAFTTKTAVYVLVRAFPGTEILVILGVAMALYGVVFAVLENDCRRLLAYHIVSQVGYMVAGVGMGSAMSLNGTVSHAFCHILYKALLFMGMGAVIEMTGKRKLTELGGLYKTMPLTMILYMIGGFSISAFPLFNGFVSKSMVIAAGAAAHRPVVVLLLTMASAGTFLHTGLKLPYYVFFGKDSGLRAKEPPTNMLIAMGIAAFLCIFIGCYPDLLYDALPHPVDFHPYTADHVVGALGILLFTGLGFFLLLQHLDPEPKISVDTDWLYRKGAKGFMWFASEPYAAFEGYLGEIYKAWVITYSLKIAVFLRDFDNLVIDGTVNSIADFFKNVGGVFQRSQTGMVRTYALVMCLGLGVVLGFYLLV
ncbi:MAG: Na(+)/H(+) antiporter subunit D [Proteobacteria bacterium]|nr:Na(+)/H(+) antiporter subunit D [Pseudomonadota bacterium]